MNIRKSMVMGVLVVALGSSSVMGQDNEQDETKSRPVHDSVLQANRLYNQTLDKAASADYFETRFADIVDELSQKHEISIVIHESAMENNLDEDQLITLNLSGISLRSMLSIMLQPFDCTYLVDDEVLYIMSRDAAADRMETRIFDCRALIDGMAGDAQVNTQKLVDVLTSTVAQASWDVNGGRARITEIGGLLVTTQSAHNHVEIQELLEELESRVVDVSDATVSAGR